VGYVRGPAAGSKYVSCRRNICSRSLLSLPNEVGGGSGDTHTHRSRPSPCQPQGISYGKTGEFRRVRLGNVNCMPRNIPGRHARAESNKDAFDHVRDL